MSGSAFRVSVHIPLKDFESFTGEVKKYVKTADSGAKRVQAFCPECGTALYAEDVENPSLRSVRIGAIQERTLIRPHRQIWCRSALPWAHEVSGITPRIEGQPG
jgi:hypothetical protein